MKAYQIMTDVIGEEYLASHPGTVDRLKAGDPEKEVRKIAVCFAPTPNVLRDAVSWGADLVISHEPTFYHHSDVLTEEEWKGKTAAQKRKAVDAAGVTIYRYHDSMHHRGDDEVNVDLLERLALPCRYDGRERCTLETPVPVRELAKRLEAALNVRHARIIGNADFSAERLWLPLGASDGYDAFVDNDCDQVAIAGELCEWREGEPIREAGEFGREKAVILLGHAGSEKQAMETLAVRIDGKYDGAEAKYFDCGELYTYTD